jgi:hypothetical protein
MALKTWDGTTGNWSDGTKWGLLPGAPADNDTVVLPGTVGGYVLTLDVNSNLLDSLQIGDGASAGVINFLIGANTLNVTGGANSIISNEPGGANIVLGGGSINAGTLGLAAANQNVSGVGTLTIGSISGLGTLGAVGGVLDVVGTINGGVNLTIDTSAGSTLKIDGTATAMNAIAISAGTQTLEIGATGNLSIVAAESITNGTIKLDGGSALTAGGGLTLGTGANLMGAGTVTASSLTGSGGTVTALGGTLTLAQSLAASTGIGFQVAGSSDLEINGQVSTGNTFTFVNNSGDNSGTVGIADETASMDVTFGNMFVATGFTPTDVIDLKDYSGSISVIASGNTGTITLDDGAVIRLINISSTTWFADTAPDSGTGKIIFLSDTACYCRGTLILTEAGEVPVEELAVGDNLVTLTGAARPIRWIGRRSYDGRFIAGNRQVLPICITAGALADGVPARDLFLSPEHSLYIDGVLAQAKHLVNGATIVQESRIDRVDYFHIELDSHDVVFADGTPAETFIDCDNRLMFENGVEYPELYPDDDRPTWDFCFPRLEWEDTRLTAIRVELMERAAELGHGLDLDPDLHLIVDGQAIAPNSVSCRRYSFTLPAGASAVSLASRSTAPAEIAASSRDVRELGVPVERISLSDGKMSLDIWHSHAALSDGFHSDEGTHRWTDGLAALPVAWLRPFAGEAILDVQLAPSAHAYRLRATDRLATTAA